MQFTDKQFFILSTLKQGRKAVEFAQQRFDKQSLIELVKLGSVKNTGLHYQITLAGREAYPVLYKGGDKAETISTNVPIALSKPKITNKEKKVPETNTEKKSITQQIIDQIKASPDCTITEIGKALNMRDIGERNISARVKRGDIVTGRNSSNRKTYTHKDAVNRQEIGVKTTEIAVSKTPVVETDNAYDTPVSERSTEAASTAQSDTAIGDQFLVSYTSDGYLIITIDHMEFELNPEQTKVLDTFLDKVAHG